MPNLTRDGDLGQLHNGGVGVPDSLCLDLDHSIRQACQQPIGDGIR